MHIAESYERERIILKCKVKYCMMTIVPVLKVFRENKIT